MAAISSSPSDGAAQETIYDLIPLDYKAPEIRLLKISPGKGPEPVRIGMFKANLDSKPEFIAFSYAWGTGGIGASIQIGGQDVGVSKTLHHALVRLRDPRQELVFWIDAISINQKSTADKNHQVPLMSAIYSSAYSVFIWLGDASENGDLAARFIGYLDANGGYEDGLQDLEEVARVLGCARGSLEAGLMELMENPWFSRTWIIQEAALPPQEPTFFYGQHRITWESFESAERALYRYLDPTNLAGEYCRSHQPFRRYEALHRSLHKCAFLDINATRAKLQSLRPCGLKIEDAISKSKNALSSDPRDRVYGLLGLLCHGHGFRIEVDYAKSTAEVFRDAMACILVEKGNLSALTLREELRSSCRCSDRHCSCRFSLSAVSGASWIPDFGNTPDFRRAHQSGLPTHFSVPGASPFLVGPGKAPNFRIEGFSLFARGLLLDAVGDTIKCTRKVDNGMSDCPLNPLVEFLWTHARVSSHEEPQEQDRDGCPSCRPRDSFVTAIVMLMKEVQRHLHELESHEGSSRCSDTSEKELQEMGIEEASDSQEGESQEMDSEEAGFAVQSSDTQSPWPGEPSDLQDADTLDSDEEAPETENPVSERSNSESDLLEADDEYFDDEVLMPSYHSMHESLLQPAPRFDKCGLYQPQGAPPAPFWEAAWRTLVADSTLADWPRREEERGACVQLELYMEKAQGVLEELWGEIDESSEPSNESARSDRPMLSHRPGART